MSGWPFEVVADERMPANTLVFVTPAVAAEALDLAVRWWQLSRIDPESLRREALGEMCPNVYLTAIKRWVNEQEAEHG